MRLGDTPAPTPCQDTRRDGFAGILIASMRGFPRSSPDRSRPVPRVRPARNRSTGIPVPRHTTPTPSGRLAPGACPARPAPVQHPATTAVGFTGSSLGGRALYDYAGQREHPIPVFAEMGSVNPAIFLPQALEQNADALAKLYTGSITLGMGQFCTKPGIMIAVASEALNIFIHKLEEEIYSIVPGKMLHPGIHKAYFERMDKALKEKNVVLLNQSSREPEDLEGFPTIASVDGETFLSDPYLHEEVFGPYSLMVKCRDIEELIAVWKSLKGQLTTSIMATEEELEKYPGIIEIATTVAGRVVFNSVPTGVEVCPSMVHGGPYPACTDSRFSAVGISAVKRWVRPVCFQNWPEYLLPMELRNENPKKIWRLVNNAFSAVSL